VKFADAHRNIEKYGIQLLKTIKPVSEGCILSLNLLVIIYLSEIVEMSHLDVQMLHDLNTYLHKAIPDTKLTIRKYLDVKFEYLVGPQLRVGLVSNAEYYIARRVTG